MEINKTFNMSMSEEELWKAIEFYMKHQYDQDIEIQHLTHQTIFCPKISSLTDLKYEKPDGVSFTCKQEDNL